MVHAVAFRGTCTADLTKDCPPAGQIAAEGEGVAAVLTPEQFSQYGLPHPREYTQSPDLVLVAKDGYGVSGGAEGKTFISAGSEAKVPTGSHGFISTEEKMNAVCVLSGYGIRPGVQLNSVENIDITPTIEQLLNVPGLSADGRVPTEALDGK